VGGDLEQMTRGKASPETIGTEHDADTGADPDTVDLGIWGPLVLTESDHIFAIKGGVEVVGRDLCDRRAINEVSTAVANMPDGEQRPEPHNECHCGLEHPEVVITKPERHVSAAECVSDQAGTRVRTGPEALDHLAKRPMASARTAVDAISDGEHPVGHEDAVIVGTVGSATKS
jgi:hypothetical protein